MTRVDPKQLDALLPPEEAPRGRPPSRRQKPVAPAKAAKPKRKHEAKPVAADTAGAGLISIDDFARIDLRVAKIVNAEQVEGAPKSCSRSPWTIGEEKPRTVFAGIKSAYDPATR